MSDTYRGSASFNGLYEGSAIFLESSPASDSSGEYGCPAGNFYFIDLRAYRKDIAIGLKPDISKPGTEVKLRGTHNLIFLAAIVGAVILSGTLPGLPAFQDAAGNVKGIHIFGEVVLSYRPL